MKLAHALRKAGMSFSEAIKRAWYTFRLKARMAMATVTFFYTKDDGSERMAVGCYAKAPQRTDTDKPKKKPNPLVLGYFDLFANDWRSCRIDRLLPDQYS